MSKQHTGILFALAVCLVAAACVQAQDATFTVLGQLPDGAQCNPLGLSDDGSVVVGYGANAQGNYEAFRWSSAEGLVGLGFYDSEALIPLSSASDVTADGATVVGSSSYGFGFIDFAGVIWDPNGTMTEIGFYEDPYYPESVQIAGVSADGSTMVGIAGNATERCVAFRWTESDGIVNLGTLPGGYEVSHAEAISADGSVIAGSDAVDEYTLEAFRWTESDGMTGLGTLAGMYESDAYDISADGTCIVGYCMSDESTEAFHWTASDGMIGLGHLTGGGPESIANATSDGGSVVVGIAGNDDEAYTYEAFVWTAHSGMRPLKQVLESDLGIDLTDWELYTACGISADGKHVTGYGYDPDGNKQGWLVYVGDEPRCLGDLSGDGDRNLTDLAILLASYGRDDGGDLDDDGDTDISDLGALLAVYGQACVW